MRTNDGGFGREQAVTIGALVSLLARLALAGGSLRGQATQPGVPAAATTGPAPSTEFSHQEAALLAGVKDLDDHLLTVPLSVLLKHAALLPDNPPAETIKLPDLLQTDPRPRREALAPVAFEGWYAGRCETKEAEGKESWWPVGTFYLMHVLASTEKDSPVVLVALTQAPPPSVTVGERVSFTGYFYKNALLPLMRDENVKKVNPVLVAKGVGLHRLLTTAPATRPAQTRPAPFEPGWIPGRE